MNEYEYEFLTISKPLINMGFYFNKLGLPKYKNVTLLTLTIAAINYLSFHGSFLRIKDNTMSPFLCKGDVIFYSKKDQSWQGYT